MIGYYFIIEKPMKQSTAFEAVAKDFARASKGSAEA